MKKTAAVCACVGYSVKFHVQYYDARFRVISHKGAIFSVLALLVCRVLIPTLITVEHNTGLQKLTTP